MYLPLALVSAFGLLTLAGNSPNVPCAQDCWGRFSDKDGHNQCDQDFINNVFSCCSSVCSSNDLNNLATFCHNNCKSSSQTVSIPPGHSKTSSPPSSSPSSMSTQSSPPPSTQSSPPPSTKSSPPPSTMSSSSQAPSSTPTCKKFHPCHVTTTTTVVETLVTVCPTPTVITVNEHTFTVTASTTLTVTACPCTITTSVELPASSPTGNLTAVASHTPTASLFSGDGNSISHGMGIFDKVIALAIGFIAVL